jgi:hypothetical protein
MDFSGNNLSTNSGVYVVDDKNGTQLNVDKNGVVKKGSVNSGDDEDASIGKFNKGRYTLVDVGSNAAAGIYWGRWEAKQGKGVDQTHVMYSTHVTNAAELAALKAAGSGPNANPTVVNATYKYVGGTSPTRSDGAVGTVNSMTVTANFPVR